MSTPSFDIVRTPLPAGPTLIEASAGTGKTYALTGVVVRLILEGVELSKILVVTFTNAATDELKTRIRTRLRDVWIGFQQPDLASQDARMFLERFGQDAQARAAGLSRLRAALLEVDEASVYTIHGFCQRVLQQSAFESGAPFEPEFVEDAPDLFDRAVADFLSIHSYEDEWTALIASNLSDEELRADYFAFHRYPATRLAPEVPPLQDALKELKAAADELCELWPERRENVGFLLRAIRWKKGVGIKGDRDVGLILSVLDEHLPSAPHGCMNEVSRLRTSSLEENAYSNTRPNLKAAIGGEPFFHLCQRVHDAHEAARQSFRGSFLKEVRETFDDLKRRAGVLTFDDLLQLVADALEEGSEMRDQLITSIRNRWTHALIDEFQDTDPLQYRIFRTAFANRPLVFVGDPKQAIYSFRGADLHAYLRAKRDAERQGGDASRYRLDTNWRSSTDLVRAVNALFSAARHPFLLDDVPFEEVASAGKADGKAELNDGLPPLVWWMLPAPDERNRWRKGEARTRIVKGVVAGVKHLLRSGVTIDGRPVSASNIAVLVRENREGVSIQDALREAGIPAVVSKSGDIWRSSEMAEIEHILRAIHRPSDMKTVCNALATNLWGFDAAMIMAFRQDEEKIEQIRDSLFRYQSLWQRGGVAQALSLFTEEQAVTSRLLALIDGERRMTNVRHVLELLHEEESRHDRGPTELIQWLRARKMRVNRDPEMAELRLETDEEAVQVVTIHKSKGLEYDIVIAPSLWSAKEPMHKWLNKRGFRGEKPCVLVHDGDEIIYDMGSEDLDRRMRLDDAERLAEDLRLAYVALTRAVHRCYVVWGNVSQSEASAPAYLLFGHRFATLKDLGERAGAAIEASEKHGDDIGEELEKLVSAHSDVMTMVEMPIVGPEARPAAAIPRRLEPRELSEVGRRNLIPWSITSYSQIAAGEPHEPLFEIERSDALEGILAFASGRIAGSCLHEIIEEADLRGMGGPDNGTKHNVRQLIERKLKAFGLDAPDVHRGGPDYNPVREVMELLERLCRTPLPLAGATLSSLEPNRTMREWSFMVPIRDISPGAIASAIARYAPEPISERYPQHLHKLEQGTLEGYLTGVADFAFEHRQRWFVLDWKSTNLGPRLEDYEWKKLQEAALDRHYILQLLIYALGLHRYLQTRMPDYDYDRHVGGAGVVFLRGVDGSTDRGFYMMRPPRALILAMEEMLTPIPA